MKRLPGYDYATSRIELAAFISLGAVGIALILLTVSNAFRFAEAREGINSALTVPAATMPLLASRTNHALTNVMHGQPSSPRS